MKITGRKHPLLRDEVREKVIRMLEETPVQPGECIPPEKELATLLCVNHVTLRAACADLVRRNILTKIPGHGTYFNGFNQEKLLSASRIAGILMQEEEHLFNEVRDQIVRELQKQGYFCRIIGLPSRSEESFLPALQDLEQMGAGTVVIMQSELEKCPDVCEYLLKERPFHTVVRVFGNGSRPGTYPGAQVMLDVQGAFRQRIEYLKESGIRRIAYLGASCEENYVYGPQNARYREIYAQEMVRAGLAEFICAKSTSDSPEGLASILDDPERPEAIITATDYLAVRILEYAKLRSIRVPEELSLIGSYNTPWAKHFNLDSYRFNIEDFAKAVGKAVAEKKRGGKILIPVELVHRKTAKTGKREEV